MIAKWHGETRRPSSFAQATVNGSLVIRTCSDMLSPAIRFVAATGRKAHGSIQLVCHVKPGVSVQRQGIAAVSEHSIEVCVAARASEGQANRAVTAVVAEVPFHTYDTSIRSGPC